MADIQVEIQKGIAVVTISNPEVHNGLTPEMALQLIDICGEINARREVGAAVIRGAGGTFCSGADTRLWDPGIAQSSDERFQYTSAIYGAFLHFGDLQVPTIAALRGATVGGGLNLAFAADLRIIADDARLISGFSKIGIHPGGGFLTVLGRLGGREATAAAALFGADFSGSDAVRLGIAWEALPDAEVEPRAMQLAELPARDPELSRQVKGSFQRELGGPRLPWHTALEMERGIQMWSFDRMHRRRKQERLAEEDSQ